MNQFLPTTAQGWIIVIGALVGYVTVFWKAYGKLTGDIDKLGTKVNEIQGSCGVHTAEITALKLEQQVSRDDRGTLREKVAANQAAIKAMQEEIQTDRLAVMSQLHANEKAAAERDAVTRERLASINERLDIERMITSVVKAMKA